MMTTHGRIRAAFFLACSVAASGCESGTGPEIEGSFDTEAALADYTSIDEALTSAGFAGFRALAGRTPFSSSPAAAVVANLSTPRGSDAGRGFALDLMSRIHAVGGSDGPWAAPIISNWTRGATYVYDPTTDDYGLAVGRTGAPATGVRFVLYAVDSAGRPIAAEETGYADLIDEGDNSLEDIVLHLIVVQADETVLDYRTTLDVTDTGGALSVVGFLQGNDVRLDFDIGAVGTEGEAGNMLDVNFELRVDARDFSITGSVSGIEDAEEGAGEVEVLVRHRTDSIRLAVVGGDGMIEGSVQVNGELFATVSGPTSDPTFLGAGGAPLTLREFMVLRHILDTVEDVFDLLEDLLDPVDELVILGIIL